MLLSYRDVSSVELLMNNHQGIKAEIDARNDSFTACIELGKSLLARKHYASEEVGYCFALEPDVNSASVVMENDFILHLCLCHLPQPTGIGSRTSVNTKIDSLFITLEHL